jgi:uncharacterized protein YndB with AHSA1/START domain
VTRAVKGTLARMARVQTRVNAPPERVWEILRDGHRYADWVVGTQEIRDVDAGFPAPETRLHYRAGVGPLTHDGHTTVLAYVPDERLELEAHAWPMGSAHITIDVRADGDGALIRFDEYPKRGPAILAHNPVTDAFMWLRGQEIMRRLKAVVERP